MFSNEYLNIIFSSVVVYIFIIIMIRITGRRELTQLTIVDMVFILLISNSVQNAMVGSNTSLLGGLAAAASLFVVNFILKRLMFRFSRFRKFVQGEEILLIYNGILNENNLKRSRVTIGELEEAIREHGVSDIKSVNLAVLEMDGSISILSDNYKTKTTRKRKVPKTLRKGQ
jgi:uncharacterized membrane protein YcaP (DUF421 family)